MFSELHVMAQELIEKFDYMESEMHKDFPDWTWKNWWFNEVSGYNKLGLVESFCEEKNHNRQIYIIEAVEELAA